MKKVCLIISVLFVLCSMHHVSAQKSLLVINGEEISTEEFMSVYMKNNTSKSATKAEIDEYLDLYINFRLKVAEAKAMQLDTFSTFKTELEGYRKTLAQPYLTKTEILDKLVAEAYDRMQWDMRASHILIKVSQYASPADTLKAYKKAIGIRNRILKGESFEKLAVEFSDDESAKGREGNQAMKGNNGDLGYFSGMDLVYEFENAAYSMKIGEISMPIRTEFGYHIIKLSEKKPAIGKVQTAHILIAIPADGDEQQKNDASIRANELYDRIMGGESYEEIAREYSDDKGSGMRGGVLPWFGVFRMLPEFIEPLYGMEKGSVSKPVLTSYGYHIIKLIDRKPVGTFDEQKNELKTRVMRDNRYKTATRSFIATLKIENGFEEYPDALKKFIAGVNDSIKNNNWTADMLGGTNLPLFRTGDRVYKNEDFAMYLEYNQLMKEDDDKEMFIRGLYEKFVDEMVMAYENDHLEQKHPAFASLMKEYHDGILLFDLTDQMVWSKALKDTTGLKAYYETIKHNYMWPERVEGSMYFFNDRATADKFYKAMKKAMKKKTETAKVLDMFNTPENTVVTLESVESGIFIKEGHPVFADIHSTGLMAPFVNKEGKYVVVKTDRIIKPEPKALNEVRGIVTNEYQNYLEREWISTLRSKYVWKVNEDVLRTLYH
jgi:peptidyl-prolyl cis-trans isomerase SurA